MTKRDRSAGEPGGLTVILDTGTRMCSVDPALEQELGYRRGQLTGRPVSTLFPADHLNGVGAALVSLVEGKVTASRATARLLHEDGTSSRATLTARLRHGEGSEPTGFEILVSLGAAGPVAASRTRVLAANEALFRSISETSPVGMALLTADLVVTYTNPAWERCTGETAFETGMALEDLFHPEDAAPAAAAIEERWRSQSMAPVRGRLNVAGERGPWVNLRIAPLEASNGGWVASLEDVSELLDTPTEPSALEELAYRATHDALTGLPNRSLLMDRIELALARARREGAPVALLFCDLDRLKLVNDTYGHEAGDELIRQVAMRMSNVVRPSDTVARLGGDEFVVLCEEISGELEASRIADRLAVAVARDEYTIADASVSITTSIGIALSRHGGTPAALLSDADTAMYRAKRDGRDRIELFDETLRDRERQRRALSSQLAAALDGQQLELHFQPIVELASGRVTGAEALVRWAHPTRGLLAPLDFLTVATETGLDTALDRVVIEAATRQARTWFDQLGPEGPTVHVNVSTTSLARRELAEVVAGLIHASGLPARQLCIEIPASSLLTIDADIEAQLERLAELGVRLAVDDFGTGSASLQQLGGLPLDIVKIDHVLTDAIEEEGTAVIEAIAALAHVFDLTVVAERIEDKALLAILAAVGCDAAQGDVFAAPAPADEARSWLHTSFPET